MKWANKRSRELASSLAVRALERAPNADRFPNARVKTFPLLANFFLRSSVSRRVWKFGKLEINKKKCHTFLSSFYFILKTANRIPPPRAPSPPLRRNDNSYADFALRGKRVRVCFLAVVSLRGNLLFALKCVSKSNKRATKTESTLALAGAANPPEKTRRDFHCEPLLLSVLRRTFSLLFGRLCSPLPLQL